MRGRGGEEDVLRTVDAVFVEDEAMRPIYVRNVPGGGGPRVDVALRLLVILVCGFWHRRRRSGGSVGGGIATGRERRFRALRGTHTELKLRLSRSCQLSCF